MARYAGSLALALLVVLGLFLLMLWMIAPPADRDDAPTAGIGVDIVLAQEPEVPEPESPTPQLQDAPPPPPAAPASLRTDLPVVKLPVLDVSTIAGPIQLAASGSIGSGGLSLGSSGAFGGFALGGGSGGGGGFGKGEGFKGRDLIPLSTARPQIPEWAYKQGIEGWVEVVYTVMPNGRVQDVKIVDAQPRGVFEAAAVESIGNWIYDEHPKARTVKQRVEFKLSDYQYNWR